jgi:hypothetical protein
MKLEVKCPEKLLICGSYIRDLSFQGENIEKPKRNENFSC